MTVWHDYEVASELEADVLRRALPLTPTTSDGTNWAVIDLAANQVNIGVGVGGVLGPTPAGCLELLAMRPLLVGAAWKVLDLLVEAALDAAGFPPDQGVRWSISGKVGHAKARAACPPQFGPSVWAPLMALYVETTDLRHSLVHRRAQTDSTGSLVGVDANGSPLRPLTRSEQDAFARVALQAREMAIAPTGDPRVESELVRHLSQLGGVHQAWLPSVATGDGVCVIRVIVDPLAGRPDHYPVDLDFVRQRQPFQAARWIDLTIEPRDRPGVVLAARLEDSPTGAHVIDMTSPPAWLS